MLHDPKWDKKVLDAVGEHLLRAAAYLDEHGWCQDALVDPEGSGRVCLVGAIAMTNPYRPPEKNIVGVWQPINNRKEYYRAQAEAWWRVKNKLNDEPATWNDMGYRTKEQVIAILHKAAYDSK